MIGILSRAELDRESCDVPDCTHEHDAELFLYSVCHPKAGIRVCYNRLTGLLTLSCRSCHKHMVDVAVAETLPTDA